MTDCLFCKIVAGEIPADRVYEDEHVVGFRDINPQAPTHVLLIPKRHVATLNDAGESDREALGALLLAARAVAADEGLAESGYRLVVNTMKDAGQVVFHVHLHLLGGRGFGWPPG
jgi:histidine triad (HIT) family protein